MSNELVPFRLSSIVSRSVVSRRMSWPVFAFMFAFPSRPQPPTTNTKLRVVFGLCEALPRCPTLMFSLVRWHKTYIVVATIVHKSIVIDGGHTVNDKRCSRPKTVMMMIRQVSCFISRPACFVRFVPFLGFACRSVVCTTPNTTNDPNFNCTRPLLSVGAIRPNPIWTIICTRCNIGWYSILSVHVSEQLSSGVRVQSSIKSVVPLFLSLSLCRQLHQITF